MDPYRAPRSPPPPPRDPMRVVLIVTGALAALLASSAIVLGVSERFTHAAAASSAHAASDCAPAECGDAPPLFCPPGVAPACTRTSRGCHWDMPASCTTEPPCPHGGTPPLCNVPDPVHDVAPPPALSGSLLERASALSTSGDNAGARALLEPHVFGGHGTSDEVRMLRGICKAQHDAECVAAVAKRYP